MRQGPLDGPDCRYYSSAFLLFGRQIRPASPCRVHQIWRSFISLKFHVFLLDRQSNTNYHFS